jgi:hypothetical protein
VFIYRRSGLHLGPYSRVKQSKKNCLTLQEGTEMSRNVGTQTINLRCLNSLKNEDLSHTSAEAWHLAHDAMHWHSRLWYRGRRESEACWLQPVEQDWHWLMDWMKACCVPASSHTALTVTFHLRHQFGYYVMDYYMPSILLVITSWVAFWLDTDAVSGRLIIGEFKLTACSAVHTASSHLSVHVSILFSVRTFLRVFYTLRVHFVSAGYRVRTPPRVGQ